MDEISISWPGKEMSPSLAGAWGTWVALVKTPSSLLLDQTYFFQERLRHSKWNWSELSYGNSWCKLRPRSQSFLPVLIHCQSLKEHRNRKWDWSS
jgi:hypothetical protein